MENDGMAKRGRKKRSLGLDISKLSKGYLRKLTALRKSLGDEIADSAFAKWLTTQSKPETSGDPHATKIADVLTPLALKSGLKIPKAGYVVRRGRGRVIVETASAKK
jgi:hypothetical protein